MITTKQKPKKFQKINKSIKKETKKANKNKGITKKVFMPTRL